MTTRTKRILALTGVAFVAAGDLLVLVCAGVANDIAIEESGQDLFGNTLEIQGVQRTRVIDRMREWAQAAPLPTSAEVTSVTKGGTSFTRAYRVTFTAPAADIEDWLRRSPGASKAVVTAPSPGIRHFKIEPGGGAAFAEITIDDTQQYVVIGGYWS